MSSSSKSSKSSSAINSAERTRIHLVSGDKGGTGKSMVSAMLVDYCKFKQEKFQAIDGDITNPTLSGSYPDAIDMVVSDDRDMRSQLNTMFIAAQKDRKTVIVDLPARSESSLGAWFTEYNVLALAETHQIEFIKWWVSDGDPSTLDLFVSSVPMFPEIRHILVKNMGLSKPIHWTVLDLWPDIDQWHQAGTIEIIEFPWMDKRLISRMRSSQQTFGELAQAKEVDDVLEQARIQGFLKQGFAALEQTQIFRRAPDKILARDPETSEANSSTEQPNDKKTKKPG